MNTHDKVMIFFANIGVMATLLLAIWLLALAMDALSPPYSHVSPKTWTYATPVSPLTVEEKRAWNQYLDNLKDEKYIEAEVDTGWGTIPELVREKLNGR